MGLKKRECCILNKQYGKEKYEKLRARIIEDMNKNPYIDKNGHVYKYGEFFPPEMSPFGYNETTAWEFFPLTKEEALAKNYSWGEAEEKNYATTAEAKDLPDRIEEVADTVVSETIRCAHALSTSDVNRSSCNDQCSLAFRIIPQELEFYRKMNLSLPRLCPNCRHAERTRRRNPMKLWKRTCQCKGAASERGFYHNSGMHSSHSASEPCPNIFQTAYTPDRGEIMYCEGCYNGEVV